MEGISSENGHAIYQTHVICYDTNVSIVIHHVKTLEFFISNARSIDSKSVLWQTFSENQQVLSNI